MANKAVLVIMGIVLMVMLTFNQGAKKKALYTPIPNYMAGSTTFSSFIQEMNVIVDPVQAGYLSYLTPILKVKTINTYDSEEKGYFWGYLNELEYNGSINMAEPAGMASCGSCSYITLSSVEMKRIRTAKAAHALWLDKNNLVPWKLSGYTSSELNYLFSKSYNFDWSLSGSYKFSEIVDYSPSQAYSYMGQFVRGTPTDTVYAYIDDLRADFRHGISMNGDPTTPVYLYGALTTYDGNNKRIARNGCQSMSAIVSRGLQNLNIPAYVSTQYYGGLGHASTIFPNMFVLNHGDDIYSSGVKSTPVDSLLMPWDYFQNNVLSCGGNDPCEDYNTQRFNALNVMNYPSGYTMGYCCNPLPTYTDCDDVLRNGVGVYGYLTTEEYDSFKASLLSQC